MIVTSTVQKRNNLIIIFMDALRLLRFVYCPRIGEIALREEHACWTKPRRAKAS